MFALLIYQERGQGRLLRLAITREGVRGTLASSPPNSGVELKAFALGISLVHTKSSIA
jgi:hypothetical protein